MFGVPINEPILLSKTIYGEYEKSLSHTPNRPIDGLGAGLHATRPTIQEL